MGNATWIADNAFPSRCLHRQPKLRPPYLVRPHPTSHDHQDASESELLMVKRDTMSGCVLEQVGSRALFLMSYENMVSLGSLKKAVFSSTGYSFQGGLILAVAMCMLLMCAEAYGFLLFIPSFVTLHTCLCLIDSSIDNQCRHSVFQRVVDTS